MCKAVVLVGRGRGRRWYEKKKFKRKYRLRYGRKIKTVPLMINDVRGLYYWGN